jgi:hypothetical protein
VLDGDKANGTADQGTATSRRPSAITLIEIGLHFWGWKVFESLDVEPVFREKDQAIVGPM